MSGMNHGKLSMVLCSGQPSLCILKKEFICRAPFSSFVHFCITEHFFENNEHSLCSTRQAGRLFTVSVRALSTVLCTGRPSLFIRKKRIHLPCNVIFCVLHRRTFRRKQRQVCSVCSSRFSSSAFYNLNSSHVSQLKNFVAKRRDTF